MSNQSNEAVPLHQHSGGENLEVMRAAYKYNRFLRELIRDHAGTAQTALDFGAGIGTFSDSVELPPQQIHCVEPDVASQAHLSAKEFRAHSDIKEVEDCSIDYVFSLNVLEHIDDDAATMNEIYRVIKPGGRLLIYVPAFMALYTSMDSHVGHHRRYRLSGLTKLVSNAGFEIEKSAYFDALGFFATLVFKLFDKPEPAPLNPRMIGLYDRYVFPASRLLSVPCSKILGKNVYMVARRPISSNS